MYDAKGFTCFAAGFVGAVIGVVCGLFSGKIGDTVVAGLITGAAVGFCCTFFPREWNEPRVPIWCFPQVGWISGIVVAVVAQVGVLGAFLNCGLGYAFGLVVSAAAIAQGRAE